MPLIKESTRGSAIETRSYLPPECSQVFITSSTAPSMKRSQGDIQVFTDCPLILAEFHYFRDNIKIQFWHFLDLLSTSRLCWWVSAWYKTAISCRSANSSQDDGSYQISKFVKTVSLPCQLRPWNCQKTCFVFVVKKWTRISSLLLKYKSTIVPSSTPAFACNRGLFVDW